MDFRILGPLEVRSEHGVVALGGTKPRAVLAVLLMHPNEPVSAERLALALWGEDAPAGAVKTVQVHVSRLRKALGDGDVVTTTAAGYQLRVRAGELDAERFEQLVERGRRALAAGQAEEAAAVLREAESLWRGPPLADLAFEPFAQTEIARLEEEQLAALEARVEAEAAAGRHAELVAELRQLVAEHPTREGLAGQLMLALYRCGRQAEALDAYQDARRRLADEIGVEPGPELRALQEAILHHDPSLKAQRVAEELPDELAAAAMSPLVGRGAELRWLLERWENAVTGTGALVTIAGPRGMGKTRLAAELADEVHQRGAGVLFASGTGSAPAVLRMLGRARETKRATLLVLDDADKAEGDVSLSIRELSRDVAPAPVLVVATGEVAEALAALRPSGARTLEPVGLEAVRAIAERYAPDRDAGDVPAEWLLEASDGVPRRVHDVAGQWARREAARRVGAVAGRAASGRAELRSMEDELAGGVVQLQTAREQIEPADGDAGPVVCPFKGLASFEAADAPYFFGRERLIAELVARLVGAPLLGVVGPSGSGKSSVVRAGLLPALAGGVLPGSEQWRQVLIRPGEHPLHELHRAMAGLDAGHRAVVAVDQFEETFTACRDEDERARFISELVRASQGHDGSVVVLAIRADFYGRCAAYPELSRLLAANHVLVGSMRHVELRRAVVDPALRVGLRVEDELAEALVSDVEHEPGALPLLSTALLELWQRRDGRRLRFATYEETGGVLGAVARLAEDAFGRLDEPRQALARTVLLRLAEVEAEGGVERRRLPLEELEAEGDGGGASVIGHLADARLLTVSEGTVEFAHEAVLREWPRLREWIEDDRDDLRVHRSLSAAAQEWLRLGRDEDVLYRGARLAEARDWAERGDPGPTQAEREFLTASRDRERRARRARRRSLTIAFGTLALALVAIAAVAAVAINERQDAERQRNIALSRQLALESGKALGVDPELSLRLALSALDTASTDQAGTALREATLGFRQLGVLQADSLDANTAAYSPDGERVVTGGADGVALVWDVATRRVAARLTTDHGPVRAARYAQGGEQIALGFEDGTLAVADASLAASRVLLHVEDHAVRSVAFSGDGERIAAALDDGTVRVLAADGSGQAQRLSGHDGPVLGVDISADGRSVVSAGEDGSVRLWRIADGGTGQILHSGAEPEWDVAFSPDGTRILGVGEDGWVRFWNARSGARKTPVSGEGRKLNAAAFSADGRRFAAGGRDGVTRVWSVAGGPPLAVLRGQRSRVYDVGFGPTSDRVVSAGDDGSVRLWDAGRTQTWTVPSETYGIDFNRDGRLLASSSDDGTMRVWETATGRMRTSLPGPSGYMAGKFSPTSDTLVIPNWDASLVRIWRVSEESGDVIVEPPAARGIESARFDPTGDRIVYVAAKGRIVVRDLGSGREVTLGGGPEVIWDAHFSPDGEHVAAVPEGGAVPVWRVDRPARPEYALKGHRGAVSQLDYSPDGRIVTAGEDRTVRVWDPGGGPAVVMRGHEDQVTTPVFTTDGSKVLSSSQDGTLRLWDSRTGAPLAVLESGEGVKDVALSRDGKIATLREGDVVNVFQCEVCGSLEEVRARALSRSPRPLTAEERRQFLAAAG
jgi:WD40 repeat protein/DNA-binding SARP family transcriptional activator